MGTGISDGIDVPDAHMVVLALKRGYIWGKTISHPSFDEFSNFG